MSVRPVKTPPASYHAVLQAIRQRPGFFTVERSMIRLDAFLSGYELGVTQAGVVIQDAGDLVKFNDWLALRLGFTSSASGVANMIRKKSTSDADAFERFFTLWDEFKKG